MVQSSRQLSQTCKVKLKDVVFTKDPQKSFQELDYSKMIYGDECKGLFSFFFFF